jgi:hypothetical protein
VTDDRYGSRIIYISRANHTADLRRADIEADIVWCSVAFAHIDPSIPLMFAHAQLLCRDIALGMLYCKNANPGL